MYQSPCHHIVMHMSRGDGVTIGICSLCGKNVIRINPRTQKEEWLNGESPWTQEDAQS